MTFAQPRRGKILLLSAKRGDTRRYRTFHPYEQLRLTGIPCELFHITSPGLRMKTREAGVVVFHRTPFDSHVEALVDTVRSRGGKPW